MARLIDLNIKQGNRDKAQEYLNRLHTQCPLSMEASSIKNLPQEAQPKPVVKEEISEDKEPGAETFAVQVGAFADRTKAENLRKELVNKGEDAYVVLLEPPNGQSLYRVRIGRFSSQSEAERLAQKLTSKGYPTKVVP